MHLYFPSVVYNRPIPYSLPYPINETKIRQRIPTSQHNRAGKIYNILKSIDDRRKVIYYPYFEDFLS